MATNVKRAAEKVNKSITPLKKTRHVSSLAVRFFVLSVHQKTFLHENNYAIIDEQKAEDSMILKQKLIVNSLIVIAVRLPSIDEHDLSVQDQTIDKNGSSFHRFSSLCGHLSCMLSAYKSLPPTASL